MRAIICADCDKVTEKYYDSGDGKLRCETCAVAKYKNETPVLIIRPPAFVGGGP